MAKEVKADFFVQVKKVYFIGIAWNLCCEFLDRAGFYRLVQIFQVNFKLRNLSAAGPANKFLHNAIAKKNHKDYHGCNYEVFYNFSPITSFFHKFFLIEIFIYLCFYWTST